MIDHDLAVLFGVETKAINQAAKRNLSRFPVEFRFQLTENEKNELVTSCDRFKSLKHSSTLPYVFTEQGVAMLSAVLRSRTAIEISISIINAFVAMRRFLVAHEPLLQRLDTLEKRQIGHEMVTDARFEQVFAALDAKRQQPEQGVFFDGQVFDAYRFVSDLLRQAQKSIVLIDNYVDDSVLALLAKRQTGVSAIVLTRSISKTLALDLEKHNAQYPPVAIREFADSHDRFLILDEKTVYHLGASLKDL
ncbi:MAG: ORF6N domain-containing protein, partial [Lentisphaerae bacterium]|nr:ORF6N domain-containing protein [Lentisphaerota bacterium]